MNGRDTELAHTGATRCVSEALHATLPHANRYAERSYRLGRSIVRASASREWLVYALVTFGATLTAPLTGCSGTTFATAPGGNDGGSTDASPRKDASSPTLDASAPDSEATRDAKGPGTDATKPSDAAKDSATDALTPAEQACTAEAKALCNLRSSCTDGFNIDIFYGSLAACISRTSATCVAALAAPDTAQTLANIESCASSYPAEQCVDYFDDDPVASCVPPVGMGAVGAPCGFDTQCASTFCATGQSRVCGTCRPLPSLGAPCQVEADCGRDVGCAIPGSMTEGTCAAFVAPGDQCLTGTRPCMSGYACVGDDVLTTTSGLCTLSPATVDAPCDGSRKTLPNCNATYGLACIPGAAGTSIGKCQAIPLVTAGMTCGNIGSMPLMGITDCKQGGLCVKSMQAGSPATCVAAAADGMSCDNDPATGPPCLTPAKCVPTADGGTAGTCTVPTAAACL